MHESVTLTKVSFYLLTLFYFFSFLFGVQEKVFCLPSYKFSNPTYKNYEKNANTGLRLLSQKQLLIGVLKKLKTLFLLNTLQKLSVVPRLFSHSQLSKMNSNVIEISQFIHTKGMIQVTLITVFHLNNFLPFAQNLCNFLCKQFQAVSQLFRSSNPDLLYNWMFYKLLFWTTCAERVICINILGSTEQASSKLFLKNSCLKALKRFPDKYHLKSLTSISNREETLLLIFFMDFANLLETPISRNIPEWQLLKI